MKRILIITTLVFILVSSCKKKDTTPTPLETGTVTDVENNTYKTVKIGNQWWMAENLRTKSYRNGRLINDLTSAGIDTTWQNTTKGAQCIYPNNSPNTQFTKYGLLYNWYAVIDTGNIAPVGWHVPSDDEWKTLEKYLGMSDANANAVNWRGTDEAIKLKSSSSEDWSSYQQMVSTNESGFTALGGCCRIYNGIWGDPGLAQTGFWWATSVHSGNKAWYRYLDYKNANVFRYYGSKNYGMSVRCVKD